MSHSSQSFETKRQFMLARELMRKAHDMRISHRRRLSILRYAWEVLQLHSAQLDNRAHELREMIIALSGYEPERWTHTDIKRVVGEVCESMDEYYNDTWGEQDRQFERDRQQSLYIPF